MFALKGPTPTVHVVCVDTREDENIHVRTVAAETDEALPRTEEISYAFRKSFRERTTCSLHQSLCEVRPG